MTVSQIVTIPVGAQGYDFAFWRPGAEIAREAYVVRYGGVGKPGKYVTRAEVDFYHSLGVAVSLVLEHGAADWTLGAAEGQKYGAEMALWCEAIGYPRGLAAIFAFDTNALPGDVRAIAFGNAAADEMNDAGYNFGPYADLDVIRVLAVRSSLNWLAGATSWSDPTKPYQPELMPGYELVHVRQIISGSTPNYDNNVTLRPWLAWLPHEVPDPVVVVPPPIVVVPVEVDPPVPPVVAPPISVQPPALPVDVDALIAQGGTMYSIVGNSDATPGTPDGNRRWAWNGLVKVQLTCDEYADFLNAGLLIPGHDQLTSAHMMSTAVLNMYPTIIHVPA